MKSTKPQSFKFISAEKNDYFSLIAKRPGENKLGENINYGTINNNTRYLILGIEESIGPQANRGLPGAENAFRSFLMRFLNMQSNRFCSGEEICIIGKIITDPDQTEEITTELVSQLDEVVTETLTTYLKEGMIPIVIGGGHNNAFPLIRAISLFNDRKINIINLDPHADCRALEGRHSGNPFSYAKHHGFLDQYTVLGLHKSYNSEYLLNYLDQNEFNYTFFEDYVDDPNKFRLDVQRFCNGLAQENIFGIELDLDSIIGMPSSAYTPSGLTVEETRFYIRQLAQNQNVIYLHLPEAAPTNSAEEKICGKTLAYLTWDFITENIRKML